MLENPKDPELPDTKPEYGENNFNSVVSLDLTDEQIIELDMDVLCSISVDDTDNSGEVRLSEIDDPNLPDFIRKLAKKHEELAELVGNISFSYEEYNNLELIQKPPKLVSYIEIHQKIKILLSDLILTIIDLKASDQRMNELKELQDIYKIYFTMILSDLVERIELYINFYNQLRLGTNIYVATKRIFEILLKKSND